MAAAEESGELRAQVLRLAAELQEATRAQEQAARCGLALLEENGDLRQRCRDLETQLEALRTELACATEALVEAQSGQKRAVAASETREEALVQEAAAKEAQLGARLEEQQGDLRQLQCQLRDTQAENEHLAAALQDLQQEYQALVGERAQLRDALRQHREAEPQRWQERCDLEEEVASLRKQVSLLASSQAELEALRQEGERRAEELVQAGTRLAKQEQLRVQTERRLEEALGALAAERERRREQEQAAAGAQDPDGEGDGTDTAPAPHAPPGPAPGLVADLFSELSLSEIHRLREQLLQAEQEAAGARQELAEARQALGAGPAPDPAPCPDPAHQALAREVAALRAALGASRQAAGTALCQLRGRLAGQQAEAAAALRGLRQELAGLREEAAAFTARRAALDARCEEAGARAAEAERRLAETRAEKRALGALLRQALRRQRGLARRLQGDAGPGLAPPGPLA
ncbi:protein bicaudal D homolog 2-like isoform X2 [Struthio camelus]